jgi:hypothetical protein
MENGNEKESKNAFFKTMVDPVLPEVLHVIGQQ